MASLATGGSQSQEKNSEDEGKGSTGSSQTSRAASLMVAQLEEQDSILCASQPPRSSGGSRHGNEEAVELDSSEDEDGVELSQMHQEDDLQDEGEDEDEEAKSPRCVALTF